MFNSYEDSINWNRTFIQHQKFHQVMDSKFGIYIGQTLPYRIKFLIPGKDNTTHQIFWPNKGGISNHSAQLILKIIKNDLEPFKVKTEIV